MATKTQSFYDRIADVHNLAMKVNGYRDSVANYLRSLDLKINSDSLVLDAGCGTGLVTLALYKAGYRPQKTYALDLSLKSLEIAREQFEKDKYIKPNDVETIQGNILTLPFPDGKFDAVVTCGVLEYVPLEDGLREMARVLKKDGILILIPVRPSLVGSVLEILYNFKTHPIEKVEATAQKFFDIIGNHKFPITDPIGWSKMLFLFKKK